MPGSSWWYLQERMLKIWKMVVDFQSVYCYSVCLCALVVLADVLEHNWNPAGEKQLSFVVCTCVFFYLNDSGFQCTSTWATSWEKNNVDAYCWFPWRNVDAAAAKRRNCRLLLKKKKTIFQASRTRKCLAQQEVQLSRFLLIWYVPRPWPTSIQKFR